MKKPTYWPTVRDVEKGLDRYFKTPGARIPLGILNKLESDRLREKGLPVSGGLFSSRVIVEYRKANLQRYRLYDSAGHIVECFEVPPLAANREKWLVERIT